MSKRLQVVIGDVDFERYRSQAQAQGVNISEWVRQALRVAERERSSGDVEAKLAAIRKAASYRFPAPDIDTMLAETEAGYLADIETGLSSADDV
jgi:hypothetical protein